MEHVKAELEDDDMESGTSRGTHSPTGCLSRLDETVVHKLMSEFDLDTAYIILLRLCELFTPSVSYLEAAHVA